MGRDFILPKGEKGGVYAFLSSAQTTWRGWQYGGSDNKSFSYLDGVITCKKAGTYKITTYSVAAPGTGSSNTIYLNDSYITANGTITQKMEEGDTITKYQSYHDNSSTKSFNFLSVMVEAGNENI